MKKFYYLLAFLFVSVLGHTQTDAISYQAVILNPDSQQLPGFDAIATVLKDTEISLRFTIINKDGFIEYEEIHSVTTDPFGMVNLFIGEGTRTSDLRFTEVLWNGTPKDLLVEIDFYNLGTYVQLSADQLTFTPQAFHRDIIATGDLEVDGTAVFNDNFIIEGETTINNNLEITGNTTIGGDAAIEGNVNIGEDLTVEGFTNLNNELFVNNASTTNLSGELIVEGQTTINNSLEVTNEVTVGGDVLVRGDVSVEGNVEIEGDQIVEGSVEIRKRLNVTLPTTLNDDLSVAGRTDLGGALSVDGSVRIIDNLAVGGESTIDNDLTVGGNGLFESAMDILGKATVGGNFVVNGLTSLNDDLKVDNGSKSLLTGPLVVGGKTDSNNSFNVNNSSPTTLGGILHVVKNAIFDDDVLIDGVLTVNNNLNIPNLVVSGEGGVNGNHIALFENTGGSNADGIAIRINNSELSSENHFVTFLGEGNYIAGRIESYDSTSEIQNQGVVYGSRGADYAEWLEKEDPSIDFMVGEVVGVKGGKISRNTQNVDHVLTISLAPIVLGNMPDENRKDAFEKVGFMGQVPVRVKGKVSEGDYIVASGNNDGYAIAIAPKNITLNDLKGVIGKAWTASEGNQKNLINVSVGLKSNEWIKVLESQEKRLLEVESQLKVMKNLSEKIKKIEAKLNVLDMN